VLNNIWENFLKIVKEEAGSRVVDTWFKAVFLHEWDSINKIVYLRVPNTFVRDWMSSNYTELINLHLSRLLNVDQLKVVLVDGGNKTSLADNKTGVGENVMAGQVATGSVMTGSVKIGAAKTGAKNSSKKTGNGETLIFEVCEDAASETGVGIIGIGETGTTLVPAKVDYSKTALERQSGYKKSCHINSNFHFDNFVVGPNNSLAKAAAQAITDKPGVLYNPLFIYGDSGLGKTHLLHAVGNSIKKKNKNLSVLYQTADRFVNEFINSIRFDKIDKFQVKYQNTDVLLIDDIQFISNKEQTQEAFFHIFNALYDSHKQIVFSSDTFPSNITGLADRLKSRLACGLVTDIYTPSLETKVAILQKKAKSNNQELSDDIAYFIASCVDSNIRELEGALIRVTAFASLTNQQLSVELAKKVLNRSCEVKKKTIDLDDISKAIQKYYDLSMADLKSKKRIKEVSYARQIAMFLMKKHTSKSLRDIGMFFGGRDHSTVLHSIEKIELQANCDLEFLQVLTSIEKNITGKN
jgi:chromosomal replication initiator protein DnaA